MNLKDCHNVDDFKKLAKKKLPSPIFHYIDGGSDDEATLRRNTESFNSCDLIPNVLTDVSNVDLSTQVFGQKISFPLFLSPTAMHRLYHHEGEFAAAKAAEKMGTMFSMSTMSTTSMEEISNLISGPKLFQLYIHKDRGLTDNLISRCKNTGFHGLCLTVDTVVAGNREREHRTGFSTPPRLTFGSLLSFILSSCTTLKEGLSGKKKDTSDAFLVKKKNPLTIPKNYSELPVPVSEEDNNDDDEDLNTNVKLAFEDLFGNQNAEISNTKSNVSIYAHYKLNSLQCFQGRNR